jgi:hypothetical protein
MNLTTLIGIQILFAWGVIHFWTVYILAKMIKYTLTPHSNMP